VEPVLGRGDDAGLVLTSERVRRDGGCVDRGGVGVAVPRTGGEAGGEPGRSGRAADQPAS
jgi:hypothetical protein